MADNVNVTEGSGKVIASDDVGGIQYQRVKPAFGVDGSATDVSSSNPMPVVQTGTPGLPTGASTETTLGTRLSESDFDTKTGSLTETAPATDTASSGLNGRLQRIAQRITSLIALLPTALGAGGGLKVDGSGTALPVSGTFYQATQPVSIATAPVLVAGSAVIGKVSTDQTTHGTTDLVAADITKIAGTAIVNGGLAGSQSIGGTVGNNVAPTGNPVPLAGIAVSSEPTANTATRISQLLTDLVGKLIVLPYANPENFVSGAITTAMTGTTSTSLISAPAAGLRNYITQITVSNAHATVGTDVIIQDGSGGTTLYTIPAAAVYGGAVLVFPTPLRQPTTATAIYCANVTTGASTKVSASGYKGA